LVEEQLQLVGIPRHYVTEGDLHRGAITDGLHDLFDNVIGRAVSVRGRVPIGDVIGRRHGNAGSSVRSEIGIPSLAGGAGTADINRVLEFSLEVQSFSRITTAKSLHIDVGELCRGFGL